jgi:hypothetical protein
MKIILTWFLLLFSTCHGNQMQSLYDELLVMEKDAFGMMREYEGRLMCIYDMKSMVEKFILP